MSEHFKMSLANIMALLVYALVAGIAFGAMQLDMAHVSNRISTAEQEIRTLREADHKATLERVEYLSGQKYILTEIRDINEFIKSYEYKESK